jgi:hypothetical protein
MFFEVSSLALPGSAAKRIENLFDYGASDDSGDDSDEIHDSLVDMANDSGRLRSVLSKHGGSPQRLKIPRVR